MQINHIKSHINVKQINNKNKRTNANKTVNIYKNAQNIINIILNIKMESTK